MFWDSSAIVPLLIEEPSSTAMLELFSDDDEVVIWWGTPVECASALERKNREGLQEDVYAASSGKLNELVALVEAVPPHQSVRTLAMLLIRRHKSLSLRAGDALQLAAARALADRIVGSPTEFVCLDRVLGEAARLEGLVPIPAQNGGCRPTPGFLPSISSVGTAQRLPGCR
jgi:uncharacterized protein